MSSEGERKSTVAGMAKKVLPWALVLAGGALVILVIIQVVRNRGAIFGGSVAMAPHASPDFGVKSLSGMPNYDEYQAKYGPAAEAKDLQKNPAPMNLTYDGADMPVPISVVENGVNQFTECPTNANGEKVGCTDEGAANYDPSATCACINCCVPKVIGCLDPKAVSYNPFANTHDSRFCRYAADHVAVDLPPQLGAQVSSTTSSASTSAFVPSVGCTNMNNSMFDPTANISDGMCVGAQVSKSERDRSDGRVTEMTRGRGCEARHDVAYLGNLKGCGDEWDLSKGYSMGATMY